MNGRPMSENENKMLLTGSLSFWMERTPMLGLVIWVLAIFCVPVGVLFRRNFGQRWLSVPNFQMGFIVTLIFATAQGLSGSLRQSFRQPSYQDSWFQRAPIQEKPVEPPFSDTLIANSLYIILLIYVLLGIYHLFIIWWRDKTNKPVYSYSNGTSHFEILAEGFMDVLNIITKPFLRLLMLTLPVAERAKFGHRVPLLFSDVPRFTNTVFEPLIMMILAVVFFNFGAASAGMFFFFSAVSVTIITQLRYDVDDNKKFDMRDSSISSVGKSELSDYIEKGEAGVIAQLKEATANETSQRKIVKPKIAEDIPVAPPPKKKVDSLDFMDIIEEMNTPPKD